MNISAPFIARPVATTLLTIGLALAGLLAYARLPVAPLPQVDFPTIMVSATLPGASPETVATIGRRAPGAASRPDRRRHRDDVAKLGRADPHRAAVRPRPQHRWRRSRRAGGDQRRPRRPAHQPAQQPHLSQGQPRRRADPGAGADVEDAHPRAALRRRLQRDPAAPVADRRHRPGDPRRRRAAGGARGAQSARAVPLRHRARGRARRPRLGQRQQPEGHDRGGTAPLADLHQRPGGARRRLPPAGHRLAQRRRGTPLRHGRGRGRGRGPAQRGPLQRTRGGARGAVPPAGRQHHRHHRRGEGGAAAPAGGPAARRRGRAGGRPLHHHPRIPARHPAHAADRGRPRHLRGVRLPARLACDRDPRRRGAAVHHRHLRRDVSAAATASTTCR